jgi:ferric-dicitrate binding protein FerR (iron transport regulator)
MEAKTPTDELLCRMSTSIVAVEDSARAEARRDRIVAHLTELVPTLPARRQRARRMVGAAALGSAAALVIVFGLVSSRYRLEAKRSETHVASSQVLALEGSVQIIRQAAEKAALPLEPISIGNADEVVTGPTGHARASLASGAEIDIDPETRVGIRGGEDEAGKTIAMPARGAERVVLGSGRVAVRVPKLGPSRSFAVATPEATIVVHGTTFSVERAAGSPGAPPRTSVDVTEGSVAVLRNGVELVLYAGDHWSSSMSSPGTDRDAVKPGDAPADVAASKSKPPSSTSRGASPSSTKNAARTPGFDKGSSLAAENLLLQTAMAARQEGDPRRAAELAGELVRRYPASPLVEEARVERMRALASAGGLAAAQGEARSYLADYPRGFARQEASRMVGSPPR